MIMQCSFLFSVFSFFSLGPFWPACLPRRPARLTLTASTFARTWTVYARRLACAHNTTSYLTSKYQMSVWWLYHTDEDEGHAGLSAHQQMPFTFLWSLLDWWWLSNKYQYKAAVEKSVGLFRSLMIKPEAMGWGKSPWNDTRKWKMTQKGQFLPVKVKIKQYSMVIMRRLLWIWIAVLRWAQNRSLWLQQQYKRLVQIRLSTNAVIHLGH